MRQREAQAKESAARRSLSLSHILPSIQLTDCEVSRRRKPRLKSLTMRARKRKSSRRSLRRSPSLSAAWVPCSPISFFFQDVYADSSRQRQGAAKKKEESDEDEEEVMPKPKQVRISSHSQQGLSLRADIVVHSARGSRTIQSKLQPGVMRSSCIAIVGMKSHCALPHCLLSWIYHCIVINCLATTKHPT